jgi:hypothetical protein
MAKSTRDDDDAFLGGGPKFNKAGDNVPLPGEKTAVVVESRVPFGGPRVWIATLVIVCLCVALYFIGDHVWGVQHNGNRPGISPSGPQNDPDRDYNSSN